MLVRLGYLRRSSHMPPLISDTFLFLSPVFLAVVIPPRMCNANQLIHCIMAPGSREHVLTTRLLVLALQAFVTQKHCVYLQDKVSILIYLLVC